ncbi:Protein QUIRKY [Camellia lanceoleosa]|uniref:Protein QUIRKY n=1 Tax=Camellia lanceoleosa TaxID=1840588 RepID=A0ACC0FL34_9ERIC|nr:Protein QUIRKY [Camellia lanceoleosa]
MSNLKLVVEVVSAHNLLPKDGQGSSTSYVELHFDNQRLTTIKEKISTLLGMKLSISISLIQTTYQNSLDAYVYNNVQANHSKSCLGKVSINGTSFVPYSDAVILHYPLE